MAARLGLVLLAGVLLAACPASAQREARRSAEPRAERNDRGRMIYTHRGVILTSDFNSSNRPSGWNGGRKVGWGSCDVPSEQAKTLGCRRSFRRWLLGRWRGWKRIKHRPPVIDQDPLRHPDESAAPNGLPVCAHAAPW